MADLADTITLGRVQCADAVGGMAALRRSDNLRLVPWNKCPEIKAALRAGRMVPPTKESSNGGSSHSAERE